MRACFCRDFHTALFRLTDKMSPFFRAHVYDVRPCACFFRIANNQFDSYFFSQRFTSFSPSWTVQSSFFFQLLCVEAANVIVFSVNANRQTCLCHFIENLQQFCIRYFRECRNRRSHVGFESNNPRFLLSPHIIKQSFTYIFTSHASPEAVVDIRFIFNQVNFCVKALFTAYRRFAAARHIDYSSESSRRC
ncbi:hypothetical protein D1872_197520 [compost metagenome]